MKKLLQRIVAIFTVGILVASMGEGILGQPVQGASVEDKQTAKDWTLFSQNAQAGAVLDTKVKRTGNYSLRVTNETGFGAEQYFIVESLVSVEKGKTYRYGLSGKANRAARVCAMIDFGERNSLLPLGGNYDWTDFEFEYVHNSDAPTVRLEILFEAETKEYWIDDVFCYEYSDGSRVGKNLVSNPSFEITDQTIPQAGDGSLEELYHNIKKSESFSAEDMSRVIGGFQYAPVFPSREIVIDGAVDDWEGYPEVSLPTLASQYHIYGGGDQDIEAWYKYAYDEKNFYLAIAVTDDVFWARNDEAYWIGDSVQLAISQYGEKYGDEIGFAHNAMTNQGEIYSSNLSKEQIQQIRLQTSHKENQTVYEAAIPWSIKFGEKPNNLLFDCLINDNDGDENGRKYCVELAPGISEGKDNQLFPYLELVDADKDFYAWIEGARTVGVNEATEYDFYIVNHGAPREFVLTSPFFDGEKKIYVPADQGKREIVTLCAGQTGGTELKISVYDGKKDNIVTYQVQVNPTMESLTPSFRKIEEYEKELAALLKQCDKMGISTDYERINYSVIQRFIQYLKDDVEHGEFHRMDYTLESLEQLYNEAKESLAAYLSGKKMPKAVPRYVTSKMDIQGQNLLADTELDGKREKRPVFFSGYGHFTQVREDIPEFQNFGMNMIQNEVGASSFIVPRGEIKGWKTNNSGNADGSVKQVQESAGNGKYAVKIVNHSEMAANVFLSLEQSLTLKPNTTYTFGFRAKGHNINGVWISINGFDDRNTVNSGSLTDWKDFQFTYTTGENPGAQQLVLLCENRTDELFLDDLYVREGENGENLLQNGGFEEVYADDSDIEANPRAAQPVKELLQKAGENNIAVSLLLSPHYFPEFLLEKYPEMRVEQSGFLKYNVLHPKAKEAIELYLRTLIPQIKDYPALNNICISNEPAFSTARCVAYKPQWEMYLKEVYHDNIDELNKVYQTTFSNFTEVTMPLEADASPLFFDYMNFNDSIFAQWHHWMADIVHELAPKIPVHAKMMSYAAIYDSWGKRNYLNLGTNHEKFAEFSDLNGNDSLSYLRNDDFGGLTKSEWYDMQTSIKNVAVANTEDHIIEDRDQNFSPEQAKHSATDLWQGAIHGRGISTIWVWERDYSPKGDFYGSVLFRPDCIAELGKTNLDMNRLSGEISALQNEPADVAILYSDSSRIYNLQYMNCMYQLYTGLMYCGKKVRFITENQIEKIHDFKLLILPETNHVRTKTLNEIVDYSGKILMFGENGLGRDEHQKPHDSETVRSIRSRSTVVPTEFDKYTMTAPSREETWEIVRKAVEETGTSYVKLVDAETGNPVQEIEWSASVLNGDVIVNANNYTWEKPKKVRVEIGSVSAEKITELRSMQEYTGTIVLQPYEPVLLRIKSSNPFFDTYGHWAENEIEKLAGKNLVNGISASRFDPESSVTRSEFIAMIVRQSGLEMQSGGKSYADVNAGDWFYAPVITAAEAGWLDGLEKEGMLFPNQLITREEMCMLAVKAYEHKKGAEIPETKIDFLDQEIIIDTTNVGKAVSASILIGYEDGCFRPQNPLTRAEAASVLLRLTERGAE